MQRSNAMMSTTTGNPSVSFLRNNDNMIGSLHRQVTDASIVSSSSNNMMSNPAASGHNLINDGFPHNSGVALSAQRNATFSNFQSQMQRPDNISSSRNATFGQQQTASSMQMNAGNASFGGGNSNMFLQRMRMNQSSAIENNAENNKMFPGVQNSNNPSQVLSMTNNQNNNISNLNGDFQQNQRPRVASVLGNSVLQQFSNSMKANSVNGNMQNQLQSQVQFGHMSGNVFDNVPFFSNNNVMNNTSEGSGGNQLGYQQQNKILNHASDDIASNQNGMINNGMDGGIGINNFERMPPPGAISEGSVFYSSNQDNQNNNNSKYDTQQHANFAGMDVNEVDMEDKLDQLDELLTESIQNEDCGDNDGNNNYLNLLSSFFDMDASRGGSTGRGSSFPQSCPDLRGNLRNTKREHASISQMRNEAFDLDNMQPSRQGRQLSCLIEETDDSTSSVTGAGSLHGGPPSFSKPMNWEDNELQNNATISTWGEGGGSQHFPNPFSSDTNFEPLSFFAPENDSDIWGGETLVDGFAESRNVSASGQTTSMSLAGAQSCPNLGNQPKIYMPSKLGAARMGRQMLLETPYETNETWGNSNQNNNVDTSRSTTSSGKPNDLLARLSATGRNSLLDGNQQSQTVSGNHVPSTIASNGFTKASSACGKPNLLLATIGGIKHRVGSVPQQGQLGQSLGFGSSNNNAAATLRNRLRHNNDAIPMQSSNSQNLFQKQQQNHGGGSNNLDQLPFLSDDVLMRLPTWSESELSMFPDDDKLQQITDDLFTS
jgi:hypothetical protein